MKNKRHGIKVMIMGLAAAAFLCACREEQRGNVIFTSGFGKDELFRIGEVSCTKAEYMIYLTNMQNHYENVFGEEIWSVTFEGVRFEENMKENVLAKIAQMKSVYLLALDKQITLSDKEKEELEKAATEYFDSLNDTEKEMLQIDRDTVLRLYTEYTLADKVYQQITGEVNPEISDDEARTITVEQIVLKTYTTDSHGRVIEYTEGMKEEAEKKIGEIRELATNGENDFSVLVGKYNEEEMGTISFQRDEVDPAIGDVAFSLEKDEVSPVIETTDGYYLLKCISTFDREQTEENKLVLIEERKNEAFGKEYEAFVERLAKKLNEDVWDEIQLMKEAEVETDSFFEIYEKYFPAR